MKFLSVFLILRIIKNNVLYLKTKEDLEKLTKINFDKDE